MIARFVVEKILLILGYEIVPESQMEMLILMDVISVLGVLLGLIHVPMIV